jgi:hypothetical protein
MLHYRFVDIPYNGHVVRYVRKSLAQPRSASIHSTRPLKWTEENVAALIEQLEKLLGVVVLVDWNLNHVSSQTNGEVAEAFLKKHGRLQEASYAWEHTTLEIDSETV